MNKLDEIKLPKRSTKEELEQLSKDKLRPLFDLELFEIREEQYRDKGLDITIELKHKDSFTNFRFQVQLKSTNTKKPNVDGSFSWQIDTSNIQYLLNAGLPSYYICYVKQTNTFYYSGLNEFIKDISDKDKNWNEQDSHTLRTSKILNKTTIDSIYEEVKIRLLATRELNERLNIGKINEKERKVSINSEYKVTDETSIVELVETIGLVIIDEGKSKDIISLNEKVSQDITSPLYNLIVGIAAYYTSNLYDSLTSLQKADKNKKHLTQELREYLKFFDSLVKFSIGIISQSEYYSIINSLRESEYLKFYIQIEQAKERFINSFSESEFKVFRDCILSILNSNEARESVKFIAGCELLLFWGYKLNLDYFHSVSLINHIENQKGPSKELRIDSLKHIFTQFNDWEAFYENLNKDIIEKKDFFAFNMCKLSELKVRFEFIVYSSQLAYENEIPDFPDFLSQNKQKQLDTIISNLNTIINNYKSINFIENLIAALSTKYEVLMFIDKKEEALAIIEEMKNLIEFHNLKEQKKKLDFLLNGGTTEEKIKNLIANTFGKLKSDKAEYDILINEMEQFDLLDEKKDIDKSIEIFTIELFPIGHFSIPKNSLEKFYEILGIDSYKLTKHLSFFFEENIIPVINILYEDITQEGYVNGMINDKEIETWRRIRKIREALFNENIRRKIIKYGL